MAPAPGHPGPENPPRKRGSKVKPDGADSRAEAVRILLALREQGRSLGDALPEDAPPLLAELVYGVTRWYWRLLFESDALLRKPLRRKDADLRLLILIGLYQLQDLRIPAHAAINETVNAAGKLGKGWAKGLVNGVLRNSQRHSVNRGPVLPDEARYSHPQWLVNAIRDSWPAYWQRILEANNERAPMVLRVNRRQVSRSAYVEEIRCSGPGGGVDNLSADGVILDRPVPVHELPGFADGRVSVQDTAAQWAAHVLPVAPGDRVLDACSAPGGKLLHILERYPRAGRVLALEQSDRRAAMILENLQRQNLSVELSVTNAADLESWWDGTDFDCVLLDAPCTGSGVIRRHPDIKHLRRPGDLKGLVSGQALLLDRLWRTVALGGHLLYVTCSVFPEENDHQVGQFLARHADARAQEVTAPAGLRGRFGLQTLPGVHNVDGFYYALLKKKGKQGQTQSPDEN